MTFSKLDSGITKSSLWSEPLHVRIVFISFLAEKDEFGFVSASRSGMIRVCNVTPEQFDEAEKILSMPDKDSKNPDNEGRRIEKVEGGWVVLNHASYRLPEDEKRDKRKEYMRDFMSKKRSTDLLTPANSVLTSANNILTPANSVLTSVSVSVSESLSASEEKEVQEKKQKNIIPPELEWVKDYCSERKNNIDAQNFIDHYTTNGWIRGKTKIKDWQACIRTWEKNPSGAAKQPKRSILDDL
jgi:hypothetical protein